VNLFCRTAALQIRDDGPEYSILTSRGTVRARHLINATESHPPLLFSKFRDLILPTQTQAAFGPSEGGSIKAGVGISTHRGFFGVHGKGILFGSDATRVPDDQAGSNQPSRFITRYVASRLQPRFQIRQLQLSHEWSGTVSYTPDEFPLVGLMDGKRCYMVGGMAGGLDQQSPFWEPVTWSTEYWVFPVVAITPRSTFRRRGSFVGQIGESRGTVRCEPTNSGGTMLLLAPCPGNRLDCTHTRGLNRRAK